MTRRPKVAYIDPEVLNEPGKCLHDDGIYRRRVGWADRPELLTAEEIATLERRPDAQYVLARRVGDRDRAMRPGHYNTAGDVFRAPQEG